MELFKKIAKQFNFETMLFYGQGLNEINFQQRILADTHPAPQAYWILSEGLKKKIESLNFPLSIIGRQIEK